MSSAVAYSTENFFITGLPDQSSALSINRNDDFDPTTLPELFQRVSSVIYRNRISQTFSIVAGASRHFALVKGLIEFCRGTDLQVAFDFAAKTITVDLALNDSSRLKGLLDDVSVRLEREIAFKQRLKKLIHLESQYRRELASLKTDDDHFHWRY